LLLIILLLEKALLYAKGIGVTKDKKMAFDLYARSSMKGHAGALCDLGWMVLFTEYLFPYLVSLNIPFIIIVRKWRSDG